jgi:preprotein translocase subunit SecD
MFQVSRWKVALVALATVFGILFAMPNLLPQQTRESLPGWVPSQTLNLGLDLRGGSYLQLEADVDAITAERVTNLVEDVRTRLRADGIAFSGLERQGDGLTVTVQNPGQLDAAYDSIQALNQPIAGQNFGTDLAVSREGGNQITAIYRPEAQTAAARQAVLQSIQVIRRRIDPDGNKEMSITPQGERRIVVQAPGDNDPERLEALIGQTARLTFHLVDGSVTPQQVQAGVMPPGTISVPMDDGTPLVLRRRAIVTGEMLTYAGLGFNEVGAPAIDFRLNGPGARAFALVTTENVGSPFAIVLDGRVLSAPNIREPITGGSGQIDGGFTAESAKDLATLLQAGALPVPLEVLEQRAVTAQLGQDAVEAGQTATLLAFAAVLVFMVLAYGFLFGGISVLALVINGSLIIAAMSVTQATLTLPGIAGLILTLAMAVDANVLIYERMRDEIRGGKNVITSMESGFGRAMVTIVDANLTTLIAAWIMFFFGEGPVRGFAWTLSIGIFTSVFTAVFVTQVVLAFWFRARRPKTLPIAS